MAKARLFGIFEDAAQRDFHRGVIDAMAERSGLDLEIEMRLTRGCRFDNLAEFFHEAWEYSGTLVAVDGKKNKASAKIEALKSGVKKLGIADPPQPLLWSIASPSIEEWMMADSEAVPLALEELGLRVVNHAARPGSAAAERTAKMRLAQWTADLLDVRSLLQGGREYAETIGRHVDASRVGASRNPDLKAMLETKLPEFLAAVKPADPP